MNCNRGQKCITMLWAKRCLSVRISEYDRDADSYNLVSDLSNTNNVYGSMFCHFKKESELNADRGNLHKTWASFIVEILRYRNL